MKEICIPVANLDEEQVAEVEIKVGEKKRSVHYRLESFPWESAAAAKMEESGAAARIRELIKMINSYDNQWELIQLYNPGPGEKHIRVLFREKPAG